MRRSFIGLVGRHSQWELESLLPESSATCQWLLTAAQQRRAMCVWAVMDRSIATEVAELLAEGDGVAALRHMTGCAVCMGPLLVTGEWTSQELAP